MNYIRLAAVKINVIRI